MTLPRRFGGVVLLAWLVGCQGPTRKLEPTNPVKPWNPAGGKDATINRSPSGAGSPTVAGDGFPKPSSRSADPGPAPIPSPAPPQPIQPSEVKLPSAKADPIAIPPEPVPPPGFGSAPPTPAGPLSPLTLPAK